MAELAMFDAAYAPDLAAVAAHGIAVNCYISGDYVNTTTQPAAAHAAGLGVAMTYEEGRAELVHATREQGRAVGRKILAALRAHGTPEGVGIAVYPSIDVAVVGADRPTACNDGFRGLRDVLGDRFSLRAYAEGAVIDALAAAQLVDGPCWLAAPTSWPGYAPNDAHVGIVQLVGSPVPGTDHNKITKDPNALGFWWPDGSNYGEAEMALTDQDVDKIAVAIMRHPIDKNGGTFVEYVRQAHAAARNASDALNGHGGVVTRVAHVQAALGDLGAAQKALQDELAKAQATGSAPSGEVELSAASIQKVSAAVDAAVKAVKWEASK